MTQFTWFQMLNNWYCWHGDNYVAILKPYQNEWHEYWFVLNNDSGKMHINYWLLEDTMEEVENRYNEILNNKNLLYYEQTIDRFQYNVWNGEPWEDTVCDVYYVDRLTGKEVLRYDAADPANTNPHYGAESDYWKLHKRGYDLEQRIPAVLGR